MAFTLKIKAKALLCPKKTDINALLKSCGMAYGSANEFYILEEEKVIRELPFCTILQNLDEASLLG